MAKTWDYAELAKSAKIAGGPEKWADELEQGGVKKGRLQMLPWVGAAVLVTLAFYKAVNVYKEKNQKKIDVAKQKFVEEMSDINNLQQSEVDSEDDSIK